MLPAKSWWCGQALAKSRRLTTFALSIALSNADILQSPLANPVARGSSTCDTHLVSGNGCCNAALTVCDASTHSGHSLLQTGSPRGRVISEFAEDEWQVQNLSEEAAHSSGHLAVAVGENAKLPLMSVVQLYATTFADAPAVWLMLALLPLFVVVLGVIYLAVSHKRSAPSRTPPMRAVGQFHQGREQTAIEFFPSPGPPGNLGASSQQRSPLGQVAPRNNAALIASPASSMAVLHSGAPTEPMPQMMFCAELIVPQGSDCTLLLDTLPQAGGEITILNLLDQPVFSVAYLAAVGNRRSITLSVYGKRAGAFGTCLLHPAAPQSAAPGDALRTQPTASLHREQSQEVYAYITCVDGGDRGRCYCIQSHEGQMNFRIGKDQARLHVTDDSGNMLAAVQPSTSRGRCTVTIRPLVDAGLVVLAVLAVTQLQREAGGTD